MPELAVPAMLAHPWDRRMDLMHGILRGHLTALAGDTVSQEVQAGSPSAKHVPGDSRFRYTRWHKRWHKRWRGQQKRGPRQLARTRVGSWLEHVYRYGCSTAGPSFPAELILFKYKSIIFNTNLH